MPDEESLSPEEAKRRIADLEQQLSDLRQDHIKLLAQRHNTEVALAEERARLDWLQSQTKGYGKGWICRDSTSGRGMRLHETSQDGASPDVRSAIDAARKRVAL